MRLSAWENQTAGNVGGKVPATLHDAAVSVADACEISEHGYRFPRVGNKWAGKVILFKII